MPELETLPYRPCVGAVILNRKGLVWVGKRQGLSGEADERYCWQMPQGGVDSNEDPLAAATREVFEETGMTSLEFLAEADGWFAYDIPAEIRAGKAWRGKYRGQTQKWYAFRFVGRESEINILEPPAGAKPEFVAWRWERLDALPDLIVPFKRPVYEQVVAAFRHLAGPGGSS